VPYPPELIDLGDLELRALTTADAEPLALAVAESIEHLRPWMPWANEESGTAEFQRGRLRSVVAQWERREEFQYGLFPPGEPRVLGAFGLMTRRGRGTLEIGYWVHVHETGKGHATRATAALTDVALAVPRVKRVLIYCDEANHASSAIPRKLGFELVRVEESPATAPAETGRQQLWVRDRPIGA